jgi:hypothetical protein
LKTTTLEIFQNNERYRVRGLHFLCRYLPSSKILPPPRLSLCTHPCPSQTQHYQPINNPASS